MSSFKGCRCGQSSPLPRQVPLRAGPLSLIYAGGDLRAIKLNGYELARRIVVAVRDRSWGTLPPVLSQVQIDPRPDSFHIIYQVEHRENEIFFSWQGEISGSPAGEIDFKMTGQAHTTFFKNRIGFCVLHPASLAGSPCTLEHLPPQGDPAAGWDGLLLHQAVFPLDLCPDQPPMPFTDIAAMRYAVGPVQVDIRFEGDAFEMEDQRNWSDASFKTYCTPLRHPYPALIQAGERVTQRIALKAAWRGTPPPRPAARRRTAPARVAVLPNRPLPFPALGLGMASHGEALSPGELERLKRLRLAHLRVDLHLSDAAYPGVLRRAVDESQSLGAPLFLALHLANEDQLRALRPLLEETRPTVALWLIYPEGEKYWGGTPLAARLALARRYLPGPFAAGTDTDFIFLQRSPPPAAELAAVTFALNPQVHAFDSQSVMETLEAQPMLLQTAHRLAGTTPVIVSPVTLKPRHNPYASGPAPALPPDELPPQVDPRQRSLFAAAWTVGSLRAMALGRAQAVTYYETTGWRGVMAGEAGSPLPQKFPAAPGELYPVYHVLAALADFVGGEVLSTSHQDGLRAQAFAMRAASLRADRLRVLVANLSDAAQEVIVDGVTSPATVRILDETTLRVFPGLPGVAFTGKLALKPYAVACLDCRLADPG